ncbi:PDZ domain-containing protein [Chloracidobacterium thermophilum]|uniref:PDZ domain-containing protein n=1 Tax=Chloracidobacterium thermophilum TaxID=458033 RepID=UPI0007385A00|nr:PDZ domain-containing protein [Chloracidobacterium thermophilum]
MSSTLSSFTTVSHSSARLVRCFCRNLLTLALPLSLATAALAADPQPAEGAPAGQGSQAPGTLPAEPRTPGIYLGVFPQTLSEQQAEALGVSPAQGVHLMQVVPNSPADKAGLQRGDVIVSINGQPVVNVEHFRDLLRKQTPGQAMTLGIVRNRQPNTVTVVPEKPQVSVMTLPGGPFSITVHPPLDATQLREIKEMAEQMRKQGEQLREKLKPQPELFTFSVSDRGRLGIRTQPLSEQLAGYFGAPGGLLITEVMPGSPAEKAGLRAGDCLLKIGDREVRSSRDLFRELRQVEAGDIKLTLIRDRQPLVVTLKPEPCAPQGAYRYDFRVPLNGTITLSPSVQVWWGTLTPGLM